MNAEMSKDELACVYAALILQDDGVPITADKIGTIIKAANVQIEPFWSSLFAKALEGVDVKTMITNAVFDAKTPPTVTVSVPTDSKLNETDDDDKSSDTDTGPSDNEGFGGLFDDDD